LRRFFKKLSAGCHTTPPGIGRTLYDTQG
jgi:hypothetical protein